MQNTTIPLRIDDQNGIMYLNLRSGKTEKTISLLDEGNKFLESIGADIVLDFNKEGKIVGIELMGFN